MTLTWAVSEEEEDYEEIDQPEIRITCDGHVC
jgi:hypothetical protein